MTRGCRHGRPNIPIAQARPRSAQLYGGYSLMRGTLKGEREQDVSDKAYSEPFCAKAPVQGELRYRNGQKANQGPGEVDLDAGVLNPLPGRYFFAALSSLAKRTARSRSRRYAALSRSSILFRLPSCPSSTRVQVRRTDRRPVMPCSRQAAVLP